MTDQLMVVANQAGLAENKSKQLLESFSESFKQAQAIVKEAKDINVTDESQGELMMEARKKRLELKAIRVEVEKTRVSLKEQIVREGKAIDGIANVIKALVIPVEEHLQTQEDFIKIRRELMLTKRSEERTTQLSTYEVMTQEFDLKNMSEEAYQQLLTSSKLAWEARQAEIKRQEQEAIAREKARVEEEKRLRAENLKLQAEAKKREAQVAKERAEQQKKLDAERKAREEAEAKIKAEAAKADAQRKAQEEAERKSLLAPDKVKLSELATTLETLEMPAVKTKEARSIVGQVENELSRISNILREKAKTL